MIYLHLCEKAYKFLWKTFMRKIVEFGLLHQSASFSVVCHLLLPMKNIVFRNTEKYFARRGRCQLAFCDTPVIQLTKACTVLLEASLRVVLAFEPR